MGYDRDFTDKFNDALEESGLTLAELSRRTGINQNLLGRYKNGSISVSPKSEGRRQKLALALGKPEDYFSPPKSDPVNKVSPKSSAALEHWRWKDGF